MTTAIRAFAFLFGCRGPGLAAALWLLLLAPASGMTRVLYLGDSFSKGAF